MLAVNRSCECAPGGCPSRWRADSGERLAIASMTAWCSSDRLAAQLCGAPRNGLLSCSASGFWRSSNRLAHDAHAAPNSRSTRRHEHEKAGRLGSARAWPWATSCRISASALRKPAIWAFFMCSGGVGGEFALDQLARPDRLQRALGGKALAGGLPRWRAHRRPSPSALPRSPPPRARSAPRARRAGKRRVWVASSRSGRESRDPTGVLATARSAVTQLVGYLAIKAARLDGLDRHAQAGGGGPGGRRIGPFGRGSVKWPDQFGVKNN